MTKRPFSYSDHKTWIRWHLRGDPDLGFIDKHYRAQPATKRRTST